MRDLIFLRTNLPDPARARATSHAPEEAHPSYNDLTSAGPTLLRKASCACGGGCPSCNGSSAEFSMSHPGDQAETDADALADRVMGKSDNASSLRQASRGSLQPEGANGSDPLHLPHSLQGRISSSRGGGRSLDTGTRAFMESRFGRDLSGVRIHTGGEAAEFNGALSSQAFTVGNDIFFGPGKYDAASNEGRSLIAHELAHTVQPGAFSGTLRRKIEVDPRVTTLPHWEKYLKRTGNVYSYDEPIRVKEVDLEILTSMLTSPRIFKAKGETGAEAERSIAQHVIAREGVVQFARDKKYRFVPGQAGFEMNPKYWTWGKGRFKTRPDVDPDEAREDLRKTPELYAIGCAAATQITVKAGGKSDTFEDTTTDDHDWIPGESGYIENPGWNGQDNGLAGENIIYVGGKRFWGHFEDAVAIRPYTDWAADVKSWNKTEPVLAKDRTYPEKGLIVKRS